MIELYKDGDRRMAIVTDAKDETTFIDEMSELLEEIVETDESVQDWYSQFNLWLPGIVDICCRYRGRGHRIPIIERTLLVAGDLVLSGGTPEHVLEKSSVQKQAERVE